MSRLKEYFMVGHSGKLERKVSERFKRPLIGRIGVGKVSILKVARQWTITTERHLGLDAPVRLTVHVDVDDWIDERVPAFVVQYIEPEGRPGTTITLEGVQTKLRDSQIMRHLQRLPLGDDFMVWRNGDLIPPRRWHGINKISVNQKVEWEEDGKTRNGRVHGEIWIRPDTKNKREQAYITEPASEREALSREPAGIDVRVNGDVITREFFGHASGGHQVNRIWGWVDADWLPILGNRTDFLRDSPAGHAFYEAVKPLFLSAYNSVRYEKDKRAKDRKNQGKKNDSNDANKNGSGGAEDTEESAVDESLDSLASRYGKALNEVLEDKPEFAPIIETPAKTSRGQPAKDRIYPVRPTGKSEPFEERDSGTQFAIVESEDKRLTKKVTTGNVLRASTKTKKGIPTGEVTKNTKAGVRLRFMSLGQLDGPFEWDLDADDLTLAINVDHPLYKAVAKEFRPGSQPHSLLCAWIVSLALAEHAYPVTGPSIAADLETVCWELYKEWKPKRGRRD